jgi:hypothetical protein
MNHKVTSMFTLLVHSGSHKRQATIFLNGMYFSEGPTFFLVWGQNFASGWQIYFSGGQITKLNWCQN